MTRDTPKEPTYRAGQRKNSKPSRTHSTPGHERLSAGRPRPKHSTKNYDRSNNPMLHRPVESGQYASAAYATYCTTIGARRSMGKTGVCWDNSVAESFFATLKNEMYYRFSFATRARARFAVAEYIEVFYNRKRMHSTIDYRTPAQALNDYRGAAAAA